VSAVLKWLESGLARHREGDLAAAECCYLRALELDGTQPDGLQLLGLVHVKTARADSGLRLLRRAVECSPGAARIRMNLGVALLESQDAGAALAELQRAEEIAPRDAEVLLNLGIVLRSLGRLAEALERLRAAIRLDPALPDARIELARALATEGRLREAETHFSQYLAARRDAGAELARALSLPPVASSVDEIASARARLELLLDELADRPGLRIEDPVRQVGTTGFLLSYHGAPNRALLEKLATVLGRASPQLHRVARHVERAPRERLRVGFASRFLRRHSVGRAYGGLFAALDAERFEKCAIFIGDSPDDEISQAVGRAAARATIVPADLDRAQAAISALELDVLFYPDIGIDPFAYFLAYSRLARVQCTSFGHPDTSGLPSIDWFVTGELVEREGAGEDYSERLAALRGVGSPVYYAPPPLPPERPDRASLGLPEGRLYACPQSLFKLAPGCDALFAALLARDPQAILLLAEPEVGHWRALLEARFARSLGPLAGRVRFLPPMPWERFVQVLGACDVVLDTPAFNGGNSTLDALWAGTPVVTLPGRFARERHAAGILRSLGLEELVASGAEDYAARALAAAGDEGWRRRVAGQVAERRAFAYESAAVVRGFEDFLVRAGGLA
jgi:predicted O-linked N-acetylglucosamine transferase (SPINDLY family)